MSILLCGLTAVGKTYVGKELAKKYGLYHFESGNVARALASNNDLKDFAAGKLFADERLMRWQCLNHINNEYYRADSQKPMILDGFPRTADQLYFAIAAGIHIDIAIAIECDWRMVEERIKNRNRDSIDTINTAMNRSVEERPLFVDLYSCLYSHTDTCVVNGTNLTKEELFYAVEERCKNVINKYREQDKEMSKT